MSDRQDPYLAFWGKTRRRDDGSPGWHPAAYHSLDVAAVASVLLREHGVPRVNPEFHALLLALVAWHDIGKFTRTFQCKAQAFWPTVLGRFQPVAAPHGHDTAGYGLLTGPLEDVAAPLLEGWGNFRHGMLRAVCGHHGRPPGSIDAVPAEEACNVCLGAARLFAADAARVVGGHHVRFPGRAVAPGLIWQLAGLAVLSDWIGSNEAWFAAHPTPIPLEQYWTEHALPQASAAVARAGIMPARARSQVALADLAPHVTEPTPLQALAATLDLPANGPSLVVIEDQTGAGKTEAALLLAHRMMAAGQAHGLFVALPTMATANAMYSRLAEAYRALFDTGEAPSLVLAHGKRGLHERFQKSILPVPDSDDALATDPADETAGAQCAAWVASDRRRAFLADVGVGTIDQALLAVLPARHAALRQLGLSQRVLIVDEAHAYDAYMSQELETLVAFHAGLGGSTIILSATLPQARRAALVTAFHRGAGGSTSELACDHYPLVTLATAGGALEQPCDPRRELGRNVVVERLATAEAAVARIAAAARAGLAVAWIRNAVDDAIEGHAALRTDGIDADLFHARFAMGDRLQIEEAAIRRFGRIAAQTERAGRVLVATQVIEQSLDLDFDLIVSDLAPIDLLIQRAGRLWRHARPDRPAAADTPRLLVVSPEPTTDADGGWLCGPLRRTRNIYRWTILWRTARELFGTGAIATPGDVRRLIEAVYAKPDDVPEGLRAALAAEQGVESAAIAMGKMNVLVWKDGYDSGQGWDSDVRTPTRLSEESVTFRLARWCDGVLSPWCQADSPRLAWALSEVSLAAWRASGVPTPTGPLAEAVAAAKREWGRWDQDLPMLVMTRSPDGWEGSVATEKGGRRATYDLHRGLMAI
ncbi:CRISPR-associated helicase Cas3' [Limobrevibacterium gyesilva]|uniref:CRISPR-associated helicase Cas3 n=1 Tax=Limobrevibacterium gyesilva TaxID=2991712 RepID=A0AA41YWZ2_9PROT|nr:CRISPR-associated helicase Cas3' [Limobrevibacterium gyesilva]MCW3476877.1 CRISPR-associated helicase Cas3' [Limobrevibacterium gyesilva]